MVFRVIRDLVFRSRGRGKLPANLTEKAFPLGNMGSMAAKTVYTRLESTEKAQPSAQISGITDTILVRRAQMLQ